MSSPLAALAVLLAALGVSPAAMAQPAGEELGGLIELLEERADSLAALDAPSKPELKQLKFLGKQLARLNKPSDGLLDDVKALKKVLKPLSKKLADDVPVQQELVISASLLHSSCGVALSMLSDQFENYQPGAKLNKATTLHAKALASLAQVTLTKPLKTRVVLTVKAAKRAKAATAKLAKADLLVVDGCPGDPLLSGDFVTALVDGAPWHPASHSAWLGYEPDGVTVASFTLSLYQCPDVYRSISYSLSTEPEIGTPYITSLHTPSPLSVSGSDDDDGSDGLTFTLYFGGVGITFTHFDAVNQTAAGTFYGFIPDGTPEFASVPLTNGSFSIQGFNTFVHPAP